MKNSFFLLACTTLFSFASQAQNFVGDWYGKLDVGIKLPLILHVKQEKKKKYFATLDSPSQKAFGLQASEVKYKNDSIFIQFSQLSAEYRAKANTDGFSGTFKQYGNSYPLVLVSDSSVIAPPNRPQNPKPPFAYNSENVTFTNTEDKVTLAGTLTYPKDGTNFKAVILVSGSGPQDRNEEMLNHKPFLVLSDYLTSRGIAVLRYDDRGFGQSKGSFSEATIYNFAKDAKAAVNYLRSLPYIYQNNIGVIGHSEGGMIAQMLAAENPSLVNFAVFMAGPAVPLDTLMLQQNRDVLATQNVSQTEIDDYIKNIRPLYEKAKTDENCKVDCILGLIKENFDDYSKKPMQYLGLAQQLSGQWFREFLKFDPADYLTKITLPIFAFNGDKDVQVHANQNIKALRENLKKAGNTDYTLKVYKDLNHLFQPCKTGAISEYEEIETTLSEDVLEDIYQWINTLK